MDLSAKDLCSRSCMQIKMFHEHPELKPKPTFNMLEGERHHKEVVSKLKDVIGMEMGGCFLSIREKCSGCGFPMMFYVKKELLKLKV